MRWHRHRPRGCAPPVVRPPMKPARAALVLALLTVPTCAALPDRPAPSCVMTVTPPAGAATDGTSTVPLPGIPSWVPSQIDSVPVQFVRHLRCNNAPAVGCFVYTARIIQLEDTLSAFNRWLVLEHEIVHSALYDAGLRFRHGPTEDRIANAIAWQRMAERQRGWPR